MVDSSYVSLSQVPEGKSFSGKEFPLLIKPRHSIDKLNLSDLTDWIVKSQDEIDNLLLQHGALLFRNFPVESPIDFDTVIRSTQLKGMEYIGTKLCSRKITESDPSL